MVVFAKKVGSPHFSFYIAMRGQCPGAAEATNGLRDLPLGSLPVAWSKN
jgi:hypothetical protein